MSVLSKLRAWLPRTLGIRSQLRKARTRLPSSVDESLGNLLDEIAIARQSRQGIKRIHELRVQKELKVHLGCGRDVRLGWINIDLHVPASHKICSPTSEDTFTIDYDLSRGLPLEDESCCFIYSSHFFQDRHGIALMRDCYRVLRPGGVFRMVIPDFKKGFAAYVAGDREFFDLIENGSFLPECRNGERPLSDYINFAVYQNGEHKQIYDEQTVVHLLKPLGYSSVEFPNVDKEIDQDIDLRTRYSLYVEAVK